MGQLSSGLTLVSGGHIISSDSFRPDPIRLMVRNGEPGWSGGAITVLVWEAQPGFPWDAKLARRTARIDPDEGQRAVAFMGLAPGRYAVTAFADRNKSGRLPRDILGRPARPVFLTRPAQSLRKMRFNDHVFHIKQSTIIELKLARAGAGVERYTTGDIHEFRTREPGKNATESGGTFRPAKAARR